MHENARRSFLLEAQNPDGGWGYFPGRTSWLEPTAWAALALHGTEAADRAYRLVSGWQNAEGGARPAARVDSPHWSAALIVTLAAIRGDVLVARRGIEYLLDTAGADTGTLMRVMYFLQPKGRDRNPGFEGWPWRPGASAWIEPTAHGITALRVASPLLGGDRRIAHRIASAQNFILHQRCQDGGWNYGARTALGLNLNSFPETTALALIGLIGRRDLTGAFETVQAHVRMNESPLSRAWLGLSLRLHGQPEPGGAPPEAGRDVLLNAIILLAEPDGHWPLLLPESRKEKNG